MFLFFFCYLFNLIKKFIYGVFFFFFFSIFAAVLVYFSNG